MTPFRLAFRTGRSFALVAAFAMASAEAVGFWFLDRFVTSPTEVVPPLVVAAAEDRARTAAPLLEGASLAATQAWLEQLSQAFWPVLNGAIVMVGEGSATARLETQAVTVPADCTSAVEVSEEAGGVTRSCRRGHAWWVSAPVPRVGTLVLELQPATSVGLIRAGWFVVALLSLLPVLVVALPVGFLSGLVATRRHRHRLHRIVDAASSWNRGRRGSRLDDGGTDELGVVARAFDALTDRVAEYVDSERALVADVERRRLSQELHDHAKQSVFAASITLGALERTVSEPHRPRVTAALEAVQSALADMGRLLNEPAGRARLTPLDLHILAEQTTRLWAKPVSCSGEAFEFDTEPHEVCAIVREALTNAMKHAGGVEVSVRWVLAPEALSITVRDGGPGFDASRTSGMGLGSMQTRANHLGARLEFTVSQPGTSVCLTLPVRRP